MICDIYAGGLILDLVWMNGSHPVLAGTNFHCDHCCCYCKKCEWTDACRTGGPFFDGTVLRLVPCSRSGSLKALLNTCHYYLMLS